MTDAEIEENPKSRAVLYWLLATGGLLVVALAASAWASSIPHHVGPGVCTATTDPSARRLQTIASDCFIAAGLSSLVGVLAARGWRVWFVILLIATPILFAVVVGSSLYVPPNCPGPFS